MGRAVLFCCLLGTFFPRTFFQSIGKFLFLFFYMERENVDDIVKEKKHENIMKTKKNQNFLLYAFQKKKKSKNSPECSLT